VVPRRWAIETLKALRGADDADGVVFSGLGEVQRFQRFREDTTFKEGDSVVVKRGGWGCCHRIRRTD